MRRLWGNSITSFAVIMLMLALAGCGSSTPIGGGGTGGGTSGSAALFAKITTNNSWTLDFTMSPAGGASYAATQTMTLGSASGSAVPYTYTWIDPFGTITSTGAMKVDNTGNWVVIDASGNATTLLPNSFTIGTVYTIENNPSSQRTGTIKAINMTKAVNGMTFNDVVQVDYTGTLSSGGGTINSTGTWYISKAAGYFINIAGMDASGNAYSAILRPGYIAN